MSGTFYNANTYGEKFASKVISTSICTPEQNTIRHKCCNWYKSLKSTHTNLHRRVCGLIMHFLYDSFCCCYCNIGGIFGNQKQCMTKTCAVVNLVFFHPHTLHNPSSISHSIPLYPSTKPQSGLEVEAIVDKRPLAAVHILLIILKFSFFTIQKTAWISEMSRGGFY